MVFAISLAVSIALHLVSVLFVAYIWTSPPAVPGATFLEMRDLVTEPVKSSPTISAPRQMSAPGEDLLQQDQPSESSQEANPPQTKTDHPEAVSSTPLGLGMSYGFVSSLGDGATLREDIRGYYLQLVEKINRVWWERAGTLSDAIRQDGIAVVVILNDGTLVDRQISRSTGSVEADRALLESIEQAAPMPPLPAGFMRDVFTAPLKITAPLQLFRSAR
jgi:TonB family protein